MSFVIDADILSTFAKIGKLTLLSRIFNGLILFPDAVHDDLLRARDAGYDYIEKALRVGKSIHLEEAEVIEKQYSKTLGRGELECIFLCLSRKLTFVSNDRKAIAEAKRVGVRVMTLSDVLWEIKKIVTNEELKQIIQDIEVKDHTILKGKENIL